MMITAVGFGPLGLLRGEWSEFAAVVWNCARIVAAGSGAAPGGLLKKRGWKNSPTPQVFD
jgi:hypothetical protein